MPLDRDWCTLYEINKSIKKNKKKNIPEEVHFVVKMAFVEGIVSVESSGLEPVGVDNRPCKGSVF